MVRGVEASCLDFHISSSGAFDRLVVGSRTAGPVQPAGCLRFAAVTATASSSLDHELARFRPGLLRALPALATEALSDPSIERPTLLLADDATDRLVLVAYPLVEQQGAAAVQILHQLDQTPRRVAALVRAYRREQGNAAMEVQLSAVLICWGGSELFYEAFTTSDDLHVDRGSLHRSGVIEIGSVPNDADDLLVEAIDASLLR